MLQVTSRAARVLASMNLRLPLALPNLKQLPPLPKLASYPAVALPVERARAVEPGFALPTQCGQGRRDLVRLDGLPLAIGGGGAGRAQHRGAGAPG